MGAVNILIQVLSLKVKNHSSVNSGFLSCRLSTAIVQRFDLMAFTSICRNQRDKPRNIYAGRIHVANTKLQVFACSFISY
jgi:hypothetical protein